jgi:hypothetical protein
VTDDERRAAFDAAVANCIHVAHDAGCSFGGFSLAGLYWLAAEGCPLPHGDVCAWCPAEATTGFPGRMEGHEGDDDYRYLVPACVPCAEAWVLIDPRWTRSKHDDRRPGGVHPRTTR